MHFCSLLLYRAGYLCQAVLRVCWKLAAVPDADLLVTKKSAITAAFRHTEWHAVDLLANPVACPAVAERAAHFSSYSSALAGAQSYSCR